MQILRTQGRELRVGDRVRSRGQRWQVSALEQFDDSGVVALVGIESGNHGVERRLLTPFDRLEPIVRHRRLRLVGRAHWRRLCRTLLAHQGPPTLLRTALTAQMQLLPHQLEPAMAIVRGLGSRVLIADAVGLGKTVQAGLILSELRARHAAERVLVLTPAGVRDQWIAELASRFNLAATLLDATAVRLRRRALPVGVSPWSGLPIVVASTDYVKQPEILRAVEDISWDLVIVDEAHGCVAPSDRHAAVSSLCRRAPHVVLLTATPHNGDEAAFQSLCGIGAQGDQLLIFRRTRSDAGLPETRRVHQLMVRPTAAEQRLHTSLRAFAAAIERDHEQLDDRVALVLATLRKRALSSPSSLERSVQKRLALLDQPGVAAWAQIALPFDADGEIDDDDAVPEWRTPTLRDPVAERSWLVRLASEARAAAAAESKLRVLRKILHRIHEPMVVFTEYRDTLIHVRNTIAPHAQLLHGGMSRDERRRALARFVDSRLLLATDAAGEGLNLHERCRVVVNLELPWNPMRLEQRIGRVDRIGQMRRVHAFHLIAAASDELAMRDRLVAKIALADAAIGAADPLRSPSNVARGESTANHVPPGGSPPAAEARAEAAHLSTARYYASGSDDVAAILELAPCTARMRSTLRGVWPDRALVVMVEAATTWSGAIVSFRLVPITCRTSRLNIDCAGVDFISNACAPEFDQAWRDAVRVAHDTFWACRLQRLQAMVAGDHHRASPSQRGLFDLREVRESALRESTEQLARTNAIQRIAAAERWRQLTFLAPLAVLILRR